MRVVHITEAWGGGVQVAVGSYVGLTAESTHTVLARPRPEQTDVPVAAAVEIHDGSILHFLVTTARRVRQLRPDVVHLHSSWAGLLRYLPLGAPTVYTPHAYAFLRRDRSRPLRGVFRLSERLAARKGVVAACSPYELLLAREMGATAFYVPPPYDGTVRTGPDRPEREAVVVAMIGRVSAQKDPAFFAACADRVRALGRADVRWRWVGGGDPALERLLRRSGVDVTGWLAHSEVGGWLADVDVYLHSSLWEGTPVAFIEAASQGLPILARDEPYVAGLEVTVGGATVEAMVDSLLGLLDEPSAREAAEARTRALLSSHSPAATRLGLTDAYATSQRKRPTVRGERRARVP